MTTRRQQHPVVPVEIKKKEEEEEGTERPFYCSESVHVSIKARSNVKMIDFLSENLCGDTRDLIRYFEEDDFDLKREEPDDNDLKLEEPEDGNKELTALQKRRNDMREKEFVRELVQHSNRVQTFEKQKAAACSAMRSTWACASASSSPAGRRVLLEPS